MWWPLRYLKELWKWGFTRWRSHQAIVFVISAVVGFVGWDWFNAHQSAIPVYLVCWLVFYTFVFVPAFLWKQLDDKLHEGCIFSPSEFNKAASEFRAAFAPAISKFKIISDANAIDKMLREELIPQGIAIERFHPLVKDKKAYQEAWENYHQSHKREGVSSIYFLDYAMGDEKERFSLFYNRINAILKFAEHKNDT